MKKLDIFLIKSFIPPFLVTFMIAIFVLLMQFLWVYVDDIAGKGLGMLILIELLGYKSAGLIPMALPLAILISSVMVMGGMAEHYELSSFKSAGVSLLRVMQPLIAFGLLAVAFSYYSSNHLIPVANLKFGSRMFDIQQQKPSLQLTQGVFNDDFGGYAIYIGRKDGAGKIYDVLIYDHAEASRGQLTQITAESGEMAPSPDGNFLLMHLRNGHQYVETRPSAGATGNQRSLPFVRTSFERWTKLFDLSEFALSRSNDEIFTQNRSMMTIAQLRASVDTMDIDIAERQRGLANHTTGFFRFLPKDTTRVAASPLDTLGPIPTARLPRDSPASLPLVPAKLEALVKAAQEQQPAPPVENSRKIGFGYSSQESGLKFDQDSAEVYQPGTPVVDTSKVSAALLKKLARPARLSPEAVLDTIADFSGYLAAYPVYEQKRFLGKALGFARSVQSQAESVERVLERKVESRIKFVYELHTKYSMAVVCFIFVFIGAPMGAIVRKGGFGYPILISIIFFMLFVILTIFCRKIAETTLVPAALAAWIPGMVLFPVGLFLTRKAMNDSKVLSTDRLRNAINRLVEKYKSKKA